MSRRLASPVAARFLVGLALFTVTGCARPYAGPKTLGSVGAVLLAGGGATWIAGERADRHAVILTGLATTLVGAAAVIAAGGWLAATISCRADPDCPEGEACKEVPAPPGGVPYKQCVKR